MSEIRPWRNAAYRTGLTIVLATPVYWLIAASVIHSVHASDRLLGNLIVVGFLFGLISFLCAALGKGNGRWALILAATAETFLWLLMAVGA